MRGAGKEEHSVAYIKYMQGIHLAHTIHCKPTQLQQEDDDGYSEDEFASDDDALQSWGQLEQQVVDAAAAQRSAGSQASASPVSCPSSAASVAAMGVVEHAVVEDTVVEHAVVEDAAMENPAHTPIAEDTGTPQAGVWEHVEQRPTEEQQRGDKIHDGGIQEVVPDVLVMENAVQEDHQGDSPLQPAPSMDMAASLIEQSLCVNEPSLAVAKDEDGDDAHVALVEYVSAETATGSAHQPSTQSSAGVMHAAQGAAPSATPMDLDTGLDELIAHACADIAAEDAMHDTATHDNNVADEQAKEQQATTIAVQLLDTLVREAVDDMVAVAGAPVEDDDQHDETLTLPMHVQGR